MAKMSTSLASDKGIAIGTGDVGPYGNNGEVDGDVGPYGNKGEVDGDVGPYGNKGECDGDSGGTTKGESDPKSVGACNNVAGKVNCTGSKFKTLCRVEGMANGEFEIYTGTL